MTRPPVRPRLALPPASLKALGPLVIVDGECAYFKEDDGTTRPNRTAFALPGSLTSTEYERAMSLGMRRSGSLVYRPLCHGCRKCQPFRVDTERFVLSRSQRRVQKRCEGLFTVDVVRPTLDSEHLDLYARYQADQHGADGQHSDEESYERFLCDSITDTWELAWRDANKKLVGVGVIDVVPGGLSTVYFFWDPRLRDLSLGVYSALYEIELCRRWSKRYYYLGFLVPGSKTMSYKAGFSGGELWDGTSWSPVPSRDLEDEGFAAMLLDHEEKSAAADAAHFVVEDD